MTIYLPTSSGVSEQASERVSAAEHASEASSAEQANELALRANERTNERVAHYFHRDSWLFWTIVERWLEKRVEMEILKRELVEETHKWRAKV